MFEGLASMLSGFESEGVATQVSLNAFIAATLQELLAPIQSFQVIMIFPLLRVSYPANAEYFCAILLQIFSFDAIDTEEINKSIWQDELQQTEQSDIGKFESLGYETSSILTNLASTIMMLTIKVVIAVALLVTSKIHCCFNSLQRRRKQF